MKITSKDYFNVLGWYLLIVISCAIVNRVLRHYGIGWYDATHPVLLFCIYKIYLSSKTKNYEQDT